MSVFPALESNHLHTHSAVFNFASLISAIRPFTVHSLFTRRHSYLAADALWAFPVNMLKAHMSIWHQVYGVCESSLSQRPEAVARLRADSKTRTDSRFPVSTCSRNLPTFGNKKMSVYVNVAPVAFSAWCREEADTGCQSSPRQPAYSNYADVHNEK